jgi:Asp-tRNAAsn/Glu-tRNAGln amidotransferase A subunit and related amidases
MVEAVIVHLRYGCGRTSRTSPHRARAGERPRRVDPQPRGLLRRLRAAALVRDRPDPRPRTGLAGHALRDRHVHRRPARPVGRSPADLGLALGVLAGPAPSDAVAWRLDLQAPRAGALRDYRVAVWLDDGYCPVDATVLDVLGSVVDAVATAGARVDRAARPCTLREPERLAQRLVQPQFSAMYPAAEYERLRTVAQTAEAAEDSPRVRHARNVTATVREHVGHREQRARIAARCARFFTEFDVLLCPITPTTAIPHDHDPGVDARRITVNGQQRPYGDQIPWGVAAGGSWACRPPSCPPDRGRAAGRVAGDRAAPGGPHRDRRGGPDRRGGGRVRPPAGVLTRLSRWRRGTAGPPRRRARTIRRRPPAPRRRRHRGSRRTSRAPCRRS